MTLDAALFTLHFVRRRTEPCVVDIYPTSAAPSSSVAPPVPSKDSNEGPSTRTPKPTAFTGTIPDVAAQRALALESNDFSKQTPSYTRVRAMNHTQYATILLDGLINDCLLASSFHPYGAKKKHIMLYSPDSDVELEKRSTAFQQAWRFHFGDQEEFAWRRERGSSSTQSAYVCEVIRKPDPNVLAAQYRPPAAKGKPGTLQIMDYNINRLDVHDKKGLEVALVMTLSALLDQEYDDKIASRGERNMYICSNGIPTDLSTQGFSSAWQEAEARHRAELARVGGSLQQAGEPASPGRSPDLDAATVDRIANLEPNELLVTRWRSISEYVDHAIHLLRSDTGQSMYLLALLSDSAETTPKAVQIAAAIKAAYYRLPDDAKGTVYGRPGGAIEDELYQYVQTLDDEPGPAEKAEETTPKKRIIRLNAPSEDSPGSPAQRASATPYQPPSKLKILLSKERIAELEPKTHDEAAGASARLDVPAKPSLPSRPVSPSQQQPHAASPSADKMGKGKAILSKLGFH
ncbi:uncharacterized protein SRS1_10643 [Sporisorium reilianum f. sp. reilianum]|uniref:Uncharacterized protein n=1 Tax=Sporisorium reilianum f. sp. reilianum TaxID=72559 RepID=A0A2N8UAH2_9BASI|nr:uncharacterized protein SRS1_10643 [Sporisorium reilianum f. sp. reilianum]